MVKTLRITSIFIALAAIFFVIFIAVSGLSADEKIEAFLKAPGMAEQLRTGSASEKNGQQQESALVRQAKAFALRIDPPPAPVAKRQVRDEKVTPRRPKRTTVSVRFELIGTSYYPLDPDNSWALISEVGKGWHWVRQGGAVGHLTIKEVKDGFVVIDDGGKTSELAPKRSGGISLLKDNANKDIAASFIEVNSEEQTPPPKSSKQSKTEMLSNIEWLKNIQKESMEVGDEEVGELGDMGEILSLLEEELKSFESNSVSDSNSVKDVNNAKSSKKTEESRKE